MNDTPPRTDGAFQPGEVINNTYRIEALLGRGGTSDVYRARNEVSGRAMALKVLKAEFSTNDDYLILLKREEEIREVRHDAVVRYSENHRMSDGRVYLLMDFVDGPGLDRKMRDGPMAADDLLVICRRVLQGLRAAHERHIVHRDLSPDNIILRAGDPAQAVIIDFGIAKDTNPGAQTIVGNEFAGKYAYAAPEQLHGRTDARTDLYSLGALLLANFRGAPPNLGNNPMEIIQSKTKPLDTSDVPEPLKTVIERMTDPEPDARFPSAKAVLDFLDAPEGDDAVGDFLNEATVIPTGSPSTSVTPPPSGPTTQPPEMLGLASDKPASPPKPVKKSRGGLIGGGVAAVLALGGGAAYVTGALDGLLGPQFPPADPYELTLDRPADGVPRAVGHVPSEPVRDALAADFGDAADLTLSSGNIPDSWGQDILATVDLLDPLDAWRLDAVGHRVAITGETTDAQIETQVEAAFASGMPGALDGTADITLINLFLSPNEVQPILTDMADCGALTLSGAGPAGFGPDDALTIQGTVAETATRVTLFDAIRAISGDRQVVLDLNVLNPTLCLLKDHLPKAPPGGVTIDFSIGDTKEPNPSGTFLVGENPVIDVVIPADITDGFLYVSIMDVSGTVYHLLPNLMLDDNSVETLRAGRDGAVPVRVAFPEDPDRTEQRLVFRVDDTGLGKSEILMIHASGPLFDGLRPMAESAEGYAEALKRHSENNGNHILTMDRRLLITQAP